MLPKFNNTMKKAPALNRWLETGYLLFGKEGPEGLHVERMARMLGLNKSGLYHYFGDLDTFIDDLLQMHRNNVKELTEKFRQGRRFDPDFYNVLLSNKPIVLCHMQLVRFRHEKRYPTVYQELNALIDPQIVRLFAPHVGLDDQPDLAARFFDQSRDMFYSRITEENLNEAFLRNLVDEVRGLIRDFLVQNPHPI